MKPLRDEETHAYALEAAVALAGLRTLLDGTRSDAADEVVVTAAVADLCTPRRSISMPVLLVSNCEAMYVKWEEKARFRVQLTNIISVNNRRINRVPN